MTNAYNTPAEQVKRMREAGLNPLFYGLDGSSAGMQQSAQALGYDRASARGLTNPLMGAVDASLKLAQEKLALSNARKSEADADLSTEKSITEALLRHRSYDLLGVNIDLGHSHTRLSDAEANKIGSEIVEIEKRVERMNVDIIEAFSRVDVAQRAQNLQEAAFAFSK